MRDEDTQLGLCDTSPAKEADSRALHSCGFLHTAQCTSALKFCFREASGDFVSPHFQTAVGWLWVSQLTVPFILF